MLNEETHNKLVEMKMWGLSSAFESYLNEPQQDNLSFDERFGLMVDREWTQRQERRLKRRLSTAKFREAACVEDINYRHPRNLDRSVIQRLQLCNWVKNHENILLTGPTGVGKTWLACALANKACRESFTAIYIRVPRLFPVLQLKKADGSYIDELARLAKADVLILDDLVGIAPLGDSERRDLLEILEDRHGRRSTIATSQLPTKKWHGALGDPTIADAFLDRLLQRAHRIDLKGKSVRDPDSERPTRKRASNKC